ncbi:hypothetical protein, partial [Sorangium cellulosum]|uniref:hypothetical protein n=1 Tax=Sorangium cellulosum TaxID=56 RepID=UPI001F48A325
VPAAARIAEPRDRDQRRRADGRRLRADAEAKAAAVAQALREIRLMAHARSLAARRTRAPEARSPATLAAKRTAATDRELRRESLYEAETNV